jgi:AcrR family transcriptional regulator
VATTTELLWRREVPLPARPGRRPRHTLDAIVTTAIQVADAKGAVFGLRDVASALDMGVMSLYSYVAERDQLLALMIDECHVRMLARQVATADWRAGVRTLAEDNLTLLRSHPWLVEQGGERTVLGPGTIGKYERELAAFEALPISDVEKDSCLTLVLDFVKASARSMAIAATERAHEPHGEWWAREQAVLERIDIAGRYPLAARIGQAAGSHYGAAGDTSFAGVGHQAMGAPITENLLWHQVHFLQRQCGGLERSPVCPCRYAPGQPRGSQRGAMKIVGNLVSPGAPQVSPVALQAVKRPAGKASQGRR